MFDPDGVIVEMLQVEYHPQHVTADVDRAIAFYRDILGMKFDYLLDINSEQLAIGEGLPGVYIKSAHMLLKTKEYTEVHQFINPEGNKKSEIRLCDAGCSYTAFAVDDVPQEYEKLQAKGARFTSRPVRMISEGPDITSVYVIDSDNHFIELLSGKLPYVNK